MTKVYEFELIDVKGREHFLTFSNEVEAGVMTITFDGIEASGDFDNLKDLKTMINEMILEKEAL
jgi:hypothetical protein